VYIPTDMEGCSGVTCSEQVAGEDGKQLMAGDMNACIEGCFPAAHVGNLGSTHVTASLGSPATTGKRDPSDGWNAMT
jgi:hypothetical protein